MPLPSLYDRAGPEPMGWLTVLRQVGEKFVREKKIFEEKSACLDSPTFGDRNLLAELILHWVAGFSHLRLTAVIYHQILEIRTFNFPQSNC